MRKRISIVIIITMIFSLFTIYQGSVSATPTSVNKQTAISALIKEFANSKFAKPLPTAYKAFKDWAKISTSNRTYIAKALKNSIILKPTYLYPNSFIKRYEFASILVKVLKKAGYNIAKVRNVTITPFTDVITISDKSNVLYLYNRGLMKGISPTKFGVSAYLTSDVLLAVKTSISKAIKVTPKPTPTPTPSPTPSPTPVPTPTPTPTPTPVPIPSYIPVTYGNLISNWEFETLQTATASLGSFSYPKDFAVTNDSRTSLRSDLGVYMRGLKLAEGAFTSSATKISSSYAGMEMLVTFDAKINSFSTITDTNMVVRINAKGNNGTIVADDFNSIFIDSKAFSGIDQQWKQFSFKVVLANVTKIFSLTNPYFSTDLKSTGGVFQIDNLQVVPVASGVESIGTFAFLKENNPSLNTDIFARMNQATGEIICKLPEGTDVTNLIATYSKTGGEVIASGRYQQSDITAVNFTKPQDYYVVNGGNVRKYVVTASSIKTGVPSLIINTDDNKDIVSTDIFSYGSVEIKGGTADYSMPLKETLMGIHGRGNSSWGSMDKKSYKMKLNTSKSILGMPSNRDWVLIANYSDKSLMRNYLAYTFASGLVNLDFTPRMKFVNMFLNGRFNGSYLIGDSVEISKSRVNVTTTPGPNTGFLVEVNQRMTQDWYNPDLLIPFIRTSQGYVMEYTDPGYDKLTADQMTAISSYIQTAENAIKTNKPANYDSLIDYKSFNDWFIVEELFKNLDSGFFASCFMHKDVGGKLKMGPVWDFDSSLGNHDDTYFNSPTGWTWSGANWLYSVARDNVNTSSTGTGLARLKARWKEIKATKIDTMFTLIDKTTEMIRPSFKENFDLWKIQGTYVWPNSPEIAAATTLDQQVTILKTWLATRIAWMNSQLAS
ncbi:MAG: CotH kinase family protein [Bacillota bacterium]